MLKRNESIQCRKPYLEIPKLASIYINIHKFIDANNSKTNSLENFILYRIALKYVHNIENQASLGHYLLQYICMYNRCLNQK